MYEMRDDIPGVKFVKGGQAGWTPVQKSGLDQAIDREEGNGTLTTCTTQSNYEEVTDQTC